MSTPGEGSGESLNSLGDGQTKINPKKLAKLEKFKAKEAKMKEQAQQAKAKRAQVDQPVKQASKQEEYIDDTPFGQKKDMSKPMLNAYSPRAVESAWYAWWEECGFFKPKLVNGEVTEKGAYVIPIPPPNVTGSLHLGHANFMRDITIRHRMRGFSVMYLPGCDHAGIATQAVVEKMIWKNEKKSRHDLGREKFIGRVWEWKEEYGNRIYKQLRMMGSSYDWSRVCFTMDPKFVTAVTEAFVRLHEEGVIYRDTRLVNWSCKLNTALSNLEVDSKELEGKTYMHVPGHDPNKKYEFGTIVSFAYPIEGSDEKIVVATTRLETMLGDTAVAVHPNDTRYTHLIGKHVIHPLNGRKIPIIADDELVDMAFGTGAVKITPAHDPNDFKVGKKHNLPFIVVFNDNGTVNSNGGEFKGLMRFDARIEVLKRLKEMGLYVDTKPNKMAIPICSRSGDIIEPMIKPQWYVNCQEMAKAAVDAVRSGELVINPKTSEKEWFSWLENIQDWCISRQLWWGHRIPCYFVKIEGQENERHDGKYWVSGRTIEEAKQKAYERFGEIPATKITLEQDDDVLDTWFSAALWPFASFGWPEKTKDFQLFYPNTLLETGWDILFFWVARMVMMGIKLTGEVPFSSVFCHAMVRDAHGRKMSKSLGNVIDPIDVIRGTTLEALHATLEKGNLDPKEIMKAKEGQKKDFPQGIPECGADALRFALCAYQSNNRDINLDIMRVDGYRKFCNKLWNATKFAMMKLGDYKPSPQLPPDTSKLSLPEQWIYHRLNVAVNEVDIGFKDYNFMNVTSSIHKFWLYELCDVYIELVKPVIDSTDGTFSEEVKQSYRETLYTCLDQGLKLLHPLMPFVTEELYQRLPRRGPSDSPSIMIAEYPENMDRWNNTGADTDFELLNSIVRAARSMMSDYGIKASPNVYVGIKSDRSRDLVKRESLAVSTLLLAKGAKVTVIGENEAVPHGCSLFVVNEDCNVHLMVKGSVDIEAEITKLEDKLSKSLKLRDQQVSKMNMDSYTEKIKDEVRQADANKLKSIEAEVEAVEKSIHNFRALLG